MDIKDIELNSNNSNNILDRRWLNAQNYKRTNYLQPAQKQDTVNENK